MVGNFLHKILRPILLVAGVLVLGLIIVALMSEAEPNSPSRAASDYLKTFQTGECGNLYDNSATEQFRTSISREDWMRDCQFLVPILSGQAEQISIISLGESRKEVVFRVASPLEVEFRVAIGLLSQEGVWLLSSFSSQAEPESD